MLSRILYSHIETSSLWAEFVNKNNCLTRYNYTKSRNYLKRQYRNRHSIPMFIGTPCTASDLIEIQRIETATYSNMAYFPGWDHFYIFEKLYNQCKVDIVFIKFFYLNGKTEFYKIIFALLEIFFLYFWEIFFSLKIEL